MNLKFLFLSLSAALFLCGCTTVKRMPSEDIEVPKLFARQIRILKDPTIASNSKEKYDAAKEMLKKVDFTFTRETRTLDNIFCDKDAIIDFPNSTQRQITFNYQYGDHYIRLTFFTFRQWVMRVEIREK